MSAFACVKCGEPVKALNPLAQKLMEAGGKMPMCSDCRNGQSRPAKAWDSYDAYLKSPEWKALSYKRLKKDGFRCRLCNGPDRLEVHHRTYERIFHEDIEDLTTLCHDCHECHTLTMKTANRRKGCLISYLYVGDRLVVDCEEHEKSGRKPVGFAPVTFTLD